MIQRPDIREAIGLYRLKEIADMTGIAYPTVWSAVNHGVLKARKAKTTQAPDAKGIWLVDAEDLRDWLDAGSNQPTDRDAA